MCFGFELPEPSAQRSFEHGILALAAAGVLLVLVPPGVPVDAATANDAREPTEGAEREQ